MSMTKTEFLETLATHADSRQVDLARALIEVPKREMADFELTLAIIEPADKPLLKALLDSNLLLGDWRRAAVRGVLHQMRASA